MLELYQNAFFSAMEKGIGPVSPKICTSGVRVILNLACTSSFARVARARISSAVAEFLLIIKFACFSEIWAPPWV